MKLSNISVVMMESGQRGGVEGCEGWGLPGMFAGGLTDCDWFGNVWRVAVKYSF